MSRPTQENVPPTPEERNPMLEICLLASRLVAIKDPNWEAVKDICDVYKTNEALCLTSTARDAFVSIYFIAGTKQIAKVASNGTSAAFSMMIRLMNRFEA